MTNKDRVLAMIGELVFGIEYRELNEPTFIGLGAKEIVWQLRQLSDRIRDEIPEMEVPDTVRKELIVFQSQVGAWADRNFGLTPAYRPLLGAVEELGELAHAQLKKEQGVRKGESRFKIDASDAVGDILVYLAHYCQLTGLSLQDAVDKTWAKVRQRDWRKYPETGEEPQTGGRAVQGEILPVFKTEPREGGGKEKEE